MHHFVLIKVELISLKWMKSSINRCWLEVSLCVNSIQDSLDLFVLLVDGLPNIVTGFKNSKKQVNLKYWYRTELDQRYFAHAVAYADSKDLALKELLRIKFW